MKNSDDNILVNGVNGVNGVNEQERGIITLKTID